MKKVNYSKNIEDLKAQLRNSNQYIISRVEATLKIITERLNIKFKFEIIDDYNFNASASKINEREYKITFNRGLISTLLIVFDRLLCDGSLFLNIGSPEKETQTLPQMSNITTNYIKTVQGMDTFLPPQCEIRLGYAKHLAKLSMDFILAHEITHITDGHIDLFGERYSMMLNELDFTGGNKASYRLDRKALEMGADRGANHMLLSSELGKVIGDLPRPDDLNYIYDNPKETIRQFCIVAFSVFRIFGDNRLNHETFETDLYPKPSLRAFFSFLQVHNIVESFDQVALENDELTKICSDAFKYVSQAFERITGIKSDSKTELKERTHTGMEQVKILQDHFNNNLNPELKRFRFD